MWQPRGSSLGRAVLCYPQRVDSPVRIERTPDGRWIVEAGSLGLRADGDTIGEAMTAFRKLCIPRTRMDSADDVVPVDPRLDALLAAEEIAEDIVFGAMADESLAEEGESIPWDIVRRELDV